jgi:hypothetical protein
VSTNDLYKRFIPGYDQLVAKAATAGLSPMSTAAGPNSLLPADEVPFLTPQILAELRAQLLSEPELTVQLAKRALDDNITEHDLHRLFDDLQAMFDNPEAALQAADFAGPGTVPADFIFDGMEAGASYQPKPNDRSYENADWRGYVFNGAAAILKRVLASGRAAFRWHDDVPSQFHYDLPKSPRLALFADFGTGLAHSWYIAKFMPTHQPVAAIHLGDVYYAGRRHEADLHFDQPLAPLVKTRELWNLAGNHDYYSGGQAYFEGIDARRKGASGGVKHRQEGSYFCLETPSFKIISIDVEYHSFFGVNPRYDQSRLKQWLERHVREAKQAGKSVILMSSDEPYTIGKENTTEVYGDVTRGLQPDDIDLWFWGNTHYCAMFDHSERLQQKFYGFCIGHGGFPYGTLDHLLPSPTHAAPYRWAETEPRFPRWTNVRPDMGNAGFVIMDLDDDKQTVSLNYYDWTNDLRATAMFTKQGTQLRHTMMGGRKRDLRRKL